MNEDTFDMSLNNNNDIGYLSLDSFQLNLAKMVLSQLDTLGQSGLEVMTSGGKSYIAAYIMDDYISRHRDAKILWIAPKSAITNVKNKIFSRTLLRDKIEYLGYEELSRGNTQIDTPFDKVKLIVFDECHKAYAKKTYENLKKLLSELENSDRLAMSATPIRYGGINTFNILVPRVTAPIQFDIRDAAEHDLLPKVVYVLANMSISSSDFKSLEQYKKLTKNNLEAEELYNKVLDTLSNFKFNLETDLGELLRNYVNSDGSNGERHIAFFGSIAELQNMKTAIEVAFKKAYPGCFINIIEYHSGASDTENNIAFKKFVIDEPEPNRIDVMLSVDKATESIHPDNVRSVLMFRGTKSVRVYLQQMGRGLMLKSYHPEDVVIFDFADNVNCVGNESIHIGVRNPEDRKSDEVSYSNSIEDIKHAIMRQFGYSKGLQSEIGLKRISECIDNLNTIARLSEIKTTIIQINKAKKIYKYLIDKGEVVPTRNIYTIIQNMVQEVDIDLNIHLRQVWNVDNDIEHFKAHWEKVQKDFESYQFMYLADDIELNDKLKKYFDSLGHSAYLKRSNGQISMGMLRDIDYIKEDMDKHDGIENSTNTHAKHKLKQLRLAYARKAIPSNICVYARRKNVDIEMSKIQLSDLTDLCDTPADRVIANEFKVIAKRLAAIDTEYNNGKEPNFDDWLNVKVKILVTYRKYRDSEMACICMSYLQNKYNYIINGYKLTQKETENGAKLLSALLKIDAGEYPNKLEEDYIFEHSGYTNFSVYEIGILKEFGITKTKYQNIENKTEFMQEYNKALNGNEDSIRKMLGYNRNSLDIKRKKLLNTTTFKQIKEDTKDTLGVEVLLRKAKLMCDDTDTNKKLRKDISEALANGTLQQISVALTPFREYELELAKQVLECDADTFNGYSQNLAIVSPLSILITRCSQVNSCSKDVIKQIIKVKNLSTKFKTRLEEICNLIEQ